jgi:hypothetical protein
MNRNPFDVMAEAAGEFLGIAIFLIVLGLFLPMWLWVPVMIVCVVAGIWGIFNR